jgi:hypothetical protein
VANRHRFIHLREKTVVPCGGVLKKLLPDAANRMNLAKLIGRVYSGPPSATRTDNDLRCSARAAIQAGWIDFSSGFPERFARQFAALSVAGGPVNSQ